LIEILRNPKGIIEVEGNEHERDGGKRRRHLQGHQAAVVREPAATD
jgi:hypothetical protein